MFEVAFIYFLIVNKFFSFVYFCFLIRFYFKFIIIFMNRYFLKFIWAEKYLGVSLDQKVGNFSVPLTEYFFWPRTDSWDQLHSYFQGKDFISHKEIVLILNTLTDVIHYWQDDTEFSKKDFYSLKNIFPSCCFIAHN